MGSIVVLGGAGGVGRVAVEALTHLDVDDVVVADLDLGAAQAVVRTLGAPGLRAAAADVADHTSMVEVLRDADVVLSCAGPFYRFGPPALRAAIDAGVNYVDICDDLDATRALLELDGRARAAGVTALIGMGNSPGLANVVVKLCAEDLLDEVTDVDICHIHGGEPFEGAGVLKHRVHAMVDDVPLFVDGAFVMVRQLEPSGAAYARAIDFDGVGTHVVHPYPHPETITLPATFPTLRRVTNLGAVYPAAYFAMTQDLVRAGMAGEAPIPVGEASVAPIDVMVALLQHERPRLLAEAGVDGAGGCLRVEVQGRKDGEVHQYVFSVTSAGAGAGQGTGIPAAIGAVLLQRGLIAGGPGVHPPEAVVPVAELLALGAQATSGMGIGARGGSAITMIHVRPDGSRETIPLLES